MLAARLEVDKWEPLLTKLTLYETVGGEEENGLVWMPVYQALRRYILARERTLHEVADERQTVALSSPVHTLDAAAVKTEVGGHSSMTGTTPGSFPDVVPNVSAPRHGRSSTGLDHRQTLDNKEGAWASTGQSSTDPSLHSAGYGARVAMALDASSVEIEKQMKASDESSSLDGPVGEELVADLKAPAP
ncbi:hypothetical protein I4F81_002806 [Pyropia yezoensis]|uniref:Uncharacterized protein n=1 Tax=Pyropia yezoensis TaxID=2788 RepID=A0ACC3BRS6_PYRYE|nr:hypothetical protein I4F81_002806 [Neopyropia yezoensis]